MPKPRVFIASSTESLNIAYAAQANLEHDAEVTVWTQGVMRLSRNAISNLTSALAVSDFGIFVLGPDDKLDIRGRDEMAPRDNVLLEMGMFVGRLGIDRSFILAPRDEGLHIPTDLAGLTRATYDAHRSDGNFSAALGPATNSIRNEIRQFATYTPAPSVETFQTFRKVDWAKILESGESDLCIAVHYFDSWVNANLSSIQNFFRKPGTTVSVVVTDPGPSDNFNYLKTLFPESSDPVLLEKITKTGRRFAQALQEVGGDPGRFSFRMSPTPLSYSAQCLDRRTLLVSIFEMYRTSRIDSPAFAIDLETAPEIRKFWDKEWSGLVKVSRLVDPLDPLSE